MEKKESTPTEVNEASVSLSDVLGAVRTLTETVSDLVSAVEEMRKEYGLKKRAGVFDQKGIT